MEQGKGFKEMTPERRERLRRVAAERSEKKEGREKQRERFPEGHPNVIDLRSGGGPAKTDPIGPGTLTLGASLFLPQSVRDTYQEKTNVLMTQMSRWCRTQEELDGVVSALAAVARTGRWTLHEACEIALRALENGIKPEDEDIAAALAGFARVGEGGIAQAASPENRQERRTRARAAAKEKKGPQNSKPGKSRKRH